MINVTLHKIILHRVVDILVVLRVVNYALHFHHPVFRTQPRVNVVHHECQELVLLIRRHK